MKKLPKVELHLHLGGSYPLNYVYSQATYRQKQELSEHLLKFSKGIGGVNYNDSFKIFPMIEQIINTEARVEKGAELLCEWLADDGVVYAEVRTGLKNLGKGYEEYLLAVLKGLNAGKHYGISTRLILSLRRATTLELAKLTVDLALKYRRQGIVGIDLSGDSTLGNVDVILPELIRAKENGLFLTAHVGESTGETRQLEFLERVAPHRIGHGVHLTPEAQKWMIDNKVPLEICLSSSEQILMVQHHSFHPGIELYKAGHPITLGTDDPLVFSTALSQEYSLFQRAADLSMDEMKKLSLESLNHAFIPDHEKLSLQTECFN